MVADSSDVLLTRQFEVFRIFQDHMNQKFSQYTLKEWKKMLGRDTVAKV